MSSLASLLASGRELRAIGFDDTPFERDQHRVPLVGVVTRDTRFEGMLTGSITRDGTDATDVMTNTLLASKFGPQVHVVLTDGLTTGGLNVLDLAELHARTQVPCIAVMRRPPDLERFEAALAQVGRTLEVVKRAGPVHTGPFVFQCVGCEPATATRALRRLTDRGKVPEPLRLAHLIGGAWVHGESGKRA